MGKSNKFDFSGRRSSGVKLGNSIGSSLEKEAHKSRKDDIIHYMDLQVPNKQLSDQGLEKVVTGIEACLKDTVVFALEDLNMASNGMTSHTLPQLASVISLAQHTIKAVNLADNEIRVTTDDEAANFETFLCALQSCIKLQRLDLSGNNLGSRAFELLAKIHGKANNIGELPTFDALAVESSTTTTSNGQMLDTSAGGMDKESDIPVKAQAPIRRCGLHFIDSISLCNTGLDVSGALWLSYVIETPALAVQEAFDDFDVEQLEIGSRLNPRNVTSTDIQCDGNNDTLGKEGSELLKKAQAVRRYKLRSGWTDSVEEQRRDSGNHLSSDGAAQSSQDHHRPEYSSRAHGIDEHDPLEELEKMRRTAQRRVIEHCGYRNAEIWSAAFDTFWTARKIRYIVPLHFEVDYRHPAPIDPQSRSHTSVVQPSAPSTTAPDAPLNGFVNGRDKHASDGNRFACYQERLSAQRCRPVDRPGDSSTQRYLFESIVDRIIRFALTERQNHVLSGDQRADAAAWGQSKTTLSTEEQWSKHAHSMKIWHLLDSIHSLRYKPDSQDIQTSR